MLRVLAVVALAGFALLLGAVPAAAHDELLGSDPADGASMPGGPSRIMLRFDLPVRPGFNSVDVVGPDARAYQDGEPQVDGSTMSAALLPLGPAGRYEIRYRVVSEDGHPVSGAVGFTLTAAGPGTGAAPLAGSTPATVAADSGSGGGGVWPWVAGAVVLVAVGVVLAVRLGR